MLLDSHGNPLRRAAGFIGGFTPVRASLPLIGALCLVGFEVPLEEDDGEEDAA